MSSDGKPLWGFRKIFFVSMLLYWAISIWMLISLVQLSSKETPEEPVAEWLGYGLLLAIVLVSAVLGGANLWFWTQIRKQRFTERNWVMGLVLLIPLVLLCFPWGFLPIISWSAVSCRGLFMRPSTSVQPPPLK
ncbi:MAG TPA: hypothetical protein VLE43_09880 [Candidatus Saccharimonadia bacterium]|nr:hypothetical protein [Candidatus Saccharimonadia bacterium]